jgi:hypothetical protein
MDGAVLLSSGGQQGVEVFARRRVEVPHEVAMRLPPRPGATGEREPLHKTGHWNKDPAGLEVVEDGAHDRLTLFGPDGGRGAGQDRGPVVGLPDRPQAQVRDDFAHVLAARRVTPGVELEHGGRDSELIRDHLDDSGGQLLLSPQRSAEIMDEGELHGEAEPVVRASMPLGQRDVLRREPIAALHLVVLVRGVKEGRTGVRCKDRST